MYKNSANVKHEMFATIEVFGNVTKELKNLRTPPRKLSIDSLQGTSQIIGEVLQCAT